MNFDRGKLRETTWSSETPLGEVSPCASTLVSLSHYEPADMASREQAFLSAHKLLAAGQKIAQTVTNIARLRAWNFVSQHAWEAHEAMQSGKLGK